MDRVPDKIIVRERGSDKWVVCVLLHVETGVPLYAVDQFRAFEMCADAVRAVKEAEEPPKI